jgi:hypothetical protein
MVWPMRNPDCAPGRSAKEIRPLIGIAEFEAAQTPGQGLSASGSA